MRQNVATTVLTVQVSKTVSNSMVMRAMLWRKFFCPGTTCLSAIDSLRIRTNLSATEIEETYGNRLRSRLREMVNLIGFDRDVKDKRK